jgi:phospholipid/cholesterol/gamma-HCH transport system substrate-binding protein
MITKAQKIKLVVFVLGTLLVAVAMFVLFIDQSLFQTTKTYYVRVPGSVNGVDKGSAVAVRGVRVGEVDDIQLFADDPQSVRLVLAIRPDVPITKSDVASLAFQGLSGGKFVEIMGDGRDATPLPPRSQIPYQASAFERVTDNATELLALAGGLLETTNELVGRLGAVAAKLDDDRVESILATTQQALERFDTAGAELAGLVHDSKAPLQRTLRSADQAFRGATDLTQDAGKLMTNVNDVVLRLNGVIRQNEDQLRAITYNLREATQSFKYQGRELRQRPSRLLIGEAPPERKLP